MNNKTLQVTTAALFCGFLAVMSVLYWVLPEKTFSQREKRYLAELPALEAEAVASGQWGQKAESYLADHMPGRDFFVGLNAYFDLATGRQQTKDIRLSGKALVEAPVAAEGSNLEKNLRAVTSFAQKTQLPVDLMLVPSAGWVRSPEDYGDSRILDEIQRACDGRLRFQDLRETLKPEDFYLTDHHWTSGGAYQAYQQYVSGLGLTPRQNFQVESHEGFYGSAYSRSGLWLTPPESLELWQGSSAITASYENIPETGVFDLEKLHETDKYTVFLGGNHPRVTLKNPEKSGKLLVIRDSFSNCLGIFLAESFGEVTMVDLRYDKQPLSQLLEQGDFDRVLVCYGINNFLQDQNIVFLTR